MLEKIPAALGRALGAVRAGTEGLASLDHELVSAPSTIRVTSAEFEYAHALPASCTVDGIGVSPPLEWNGLPVTTRAIALIVEDADSPTPMPRTHAIMVDLPLDRRFLHEGELSALRSGYLPPDPPRGHGVHRYYFQLFALDAPLALRGTFGRCAVVAAMRGHVLAKGVLVGCYARH